MNCVKFKMSRNCKSNLECQTVVIYSINLALGGGKYYIIKLGCLKNLFQKAQKICEFSNLILKK